MIVDDLNVESVSIFPPEAKPPLLVDSNAELPGAIAGQCFKPIGRRNSQVVYILGHIEHRELEKRPPLNIQRQTSGALLVPYLFRFGVCKALDHFPYIGLFPHCVNIFPCGVNIRMVLPFERVAAFIDYVQCFLQIVADAQPDLAQNARIGGLVQPQAVAGYVAKEKWNYITGHRRERYYAHDRANLRHAEPPAGMRPAPRITRAW